MLQRPFLKNFAATLVIKLFGRYRAEDFVEINDQAGEVGVFKWFYTKVRLHNGEAIMCPNDKIISKSIANFFKKSISRMDINILISKGLDSEIVKNALLKKIVQPLNLEYPKPMIFVAKESEKHVLLSLQSWLKKENYDEVCNDSLNHVISMLISVEPATNSIGRGFEIKSN